MIIVWLILFCKFRKSTKLLPFEGKSISQNAGIQGPPSSPPQPTSVHFGDALQKVLFFLYTFWYVLVMLKIYHQG